MSILKTIRRESRPLGTRSLISARLLAFRFRPSVICWLASLGEVEGGGGMGRRERGV